MDRKKEIRGIYIKKRADISTELKKNEQQAIFKKIKRVTDIKKSENIMIYYSMPSEVDTRKLIKYLLDKKKKVWIPVITGKTIRPARLRDSEKIKEGKFGIPVPAGSELEFIDPIKLDIIIVPGVSFTASGTRMGRGGGYYDRFLSRLKGRVKTIGICYCKQVAKSLPAGKNDIKVDELITSN